MRRTTQTVMAQTTNESNYFDNKQVGRAMFKNVGRQTPAMIQAFRAIAKQGSMGPKRSRNKEWVRTSLPVGIKPKL